VKLRGPNDWDRFKGRRVRIERKAPDPTLHATLLGASDGHPLVRREDGTELSHRPLDDEIDAPSFLKPFAATAIQRVGSIADRESNAFSNGSKATRQP